VKLRFSRPAARDLDQVLDYLSRRSPQGARNVQRRIEAMIAMLRQHPEAGQPTSRRDTRRVVVSP